jgi:hypothetical protein
LALQGIAADYAWHGSGPSRDEVEHYLSQDVDTPTPSIVRSTEIENMRQGRTQLPTYSTELDTDTGPVFVYVSPETHGDCYTNPALRPRARYMRSKVLADLSLAAYWHSALRGVCFRAYLKGHYFKETIWTGAVIGWKMSSSNFPTYGTIPLPSSNVQSVFCVDSLADPDLLSPYNPDLFGSGIRVISGATTYHFATCYRTTDANISLILAANSGNRHLRQSDSSGFLSLKYGRSTIASFNLNPPDAKQRLHDILFTNNNTDMGW